MNSEQVLEITYINFRLICGPDLAHSIVSTPTPSSSTNGTSRQSRAYFAGSAYSVCHRSHSPTLIHTAPLLDLRELVDPYIISDMSLRNKNVLIVRSKAMRTFS